MESLADQLAYTLEQRHDPAVPITVVRTSQLDDGSRECILIFAPCCPVALRDAQLIPQVAPAPLYQTTLLLCMAYCVVVQGLEVLQSPILQHQLQPPAKNSLSLREAIFIVNFLESWCREGGSNPHEVALGGF